MHQTVRRSTTCSAKKYSLVALLSLVSSPTRSQSLFVSFTDLDVGFGPPRLSSRESNTVSRFLSYRGGTAALRSTITSSIEANTMQIKSPSVKLCQLRERMKELDLDVYLVPTDDPHLSEYVPKAYMRRAFLTGFTGSAGTAVVTHEQALLWTDSRYWNEAGMQLDSDLWVLQKAGLPSTPTIAKWLAEQAAGKFKKDSNKLRIGLDPFVHPASFAKDVEKAMKEVAMSEFDNEDMNLSEFITENENLIDPIWGSERPDIPTSPFRVHDIRYAGTTVSQKIEKVRCEMEKKHATMAVFSTLDDVAYLLNIRATGDIDTCPVGIAYATLTSDRCTLYCDSRKLASEAVKTHLDDSGIVVEPYENILSGVRLHCENFEVKPKIWLDKSRSNLALASVIPERCAIDSQNAITPMKAAKNKAELEGMREAHIHDGVAMANFMAWLENEIVNNGRPVDEVEIDEALTSFRAKQPGFVECSFPTIAGVGSNGAIIHYRAKRDSVMKGLDRQSPILLDSGGQYACGTTDVTRTWSFQETPNPEFKDYYTRVLKGHIGVDQMIFPENTPGFVLDVFARRSLWNIGKDYGHGTGHGVGAALNVHEGPISISPRFSNTEGLKSGMVVSNEPGYYEDGKFGVRIENLLEIRYVNPDHNDDRDEVSSEASQSNEKKFLKFARLTQIPIQKSLINVDLMTTEELDWLDAYHEEILSKVGARLEVDSPGLNWLIKSCEKIQR